MNAQRATFNEIKVKTDRLESLSAETAKIAVFDQKIISKSLIPFHFPGISGSNDVLSIHVP